jgi:hypothetical protein
LGAYSIAIAVKVDPNTWVIYGQGLT